MANNNKQWGISSGNQTNHRAPKPNRTPEEVFKQTKDQHRREGGGFSSEDAQSLSRPGAGGTAGFN